jgi:hypothetical protein
MVSRGDGGVEWYKKMLYALARAISLTYLTSGSLCYKKKKGPQRYNARKVKRQDYSLRWDLTSNMADFG